MSILTGFKKYKKYKKTSEGYQLQSQWTSAQTVEMGNGNTAETNLGAIQGITDSLTATNSNIALSAKSGKSLQDQITELNTGMGGFTLVFDVAGDTVKEKLSNMPAGSILNQPRWTPYLDFPVQYSGYWNLEIIKFGDLSSYNRITLRSMDKVYIGRINTQGNIVWETLTTQNDIRWKSLGNFPASKYFDISQFGFTELHIRVSCNLYRVTINVISEDVTEDTGYFYGGGCNKINGDAFMCAVAVTRTLVHLENFIVSTTDLTPSSFIEVLYR